MNDTAMKSVTAHPRFAHLGFIPDNYQGKRKLAALMRGKGMPNSKRIKAQKGGGHGPVGWSRWRRLMGRKPKPRASKMDQALAAIGVGDLEKANALMKEAA